MTPQVQYNIDKATLENMLYQMHCYLKDNDIDSALNHYDDKFILNIYDCFVSYIDAIYSHHLRDVLGLTDEDTDLYSADSAANENRMRLIAFTRFLYRRAQLNEAAPRTKSQKASNRRAHARHIFWAKETALKERIVQLVDELVRKGLSRRAAAVNLAGNSIKRFKCELTVDQILYCYRQA